MTGKSSFCSKKTKSAFMMRLSILAIGIISMWLSPCFGMDALTQSELGELSGRVGFSIAFQNATTEMSVTATFNAISYGDADGWGSAGTGNRNPGWLVLIGNGSNTGTLGINLSRSTVLEIDVGTTGSTECSPAGGAPYAGIKIPADTPFFSFSLTEMDFILRSPKTVNISLSRSGGSNDDVTGYMLAENVAIDKDTLKSTCYIWPH